MGALFGKPKKKSRISDIDRSVLSMKAQRDKLVACRRQLECKYSVAEVAVKRYDFLPYT
jgi:hypothetical protein